MNVENDNPNPQGINQPEANILLARQHLGLKRSKCTKSSLLTLLELEFGYYTPGPRMSRMAFLKDVLSGQKLLIQKAQLIPVFRLEHFEGLTIPRILQVGFERVPNFGMYLPEGHDPASIERPYLLNSLVPNSVETILRNAIARSNAGRTQGGQQELRIVLSPQFREIFRNQLLPLGKQLLTKVVHSAS